MKALSMWEHDLPRDPHERPFSDLKRNADGKFDDGELANILTESIEDTAGILSSRNAVPRSYSLF